MPDNTQTSLTGDEVPDLIQSVEELTQDGAAITVTSVKISASEKVSTGQYENYNPHTTLEGQIVTPGPWSDHREDIISQVLDMHRTTQKILQRATDNKLSDPDFEDWSGEDL